MFIVVNKKQLINSDHIKWVYVDRDNERIELRYDDNGSSAFHGTDTIDDILDQLMSVNRKRE